VGGETRVVHTPPRGGRCSAYAHRLARRARAQGINGNKMEKACDLCHITLNKNAVVGDVSALAPGGVRVGAPAMTSRGLVEADFKVIADFLHELVQLCLDVQKQTGKLYKDFEKCGPGRARPAPGAGPARAPARQRMVAVPYVCCPMCYLFDGWSLTTYR